MSLKDIDRLCHIPVSAPGCIDTAEATRLCLHIKYDLGLDRLAQLLQDLVAERDELVLCLQAVKDLDEGVFDLVDVPASYADPS